MYNKRDKGKKYENLVAEYLEENGYKIIEKNFRSRAGEIDIIFKDEDTIVFGEVKYRKNISCGYGHEAVNYKKQKNIYETARYFLYKNHIPETCKCRFDVIAVIENKIEHIVNAFGGF